MATPSCRMSPLTRRPAEAESRHALRIHQADAGGRPDRRAATSVQVPRTTTNGADITGSQVLVVRWRRRKPIASRRSCDRRAPQASRQGAARHEPPHAGERWYRRVLHLYPKDFRDEFGGEMSQAVPGPPERRTLVEPLVQSAGGSRAHRTVGTSEHAEADLRHSWRSLRRTPIVIATAVLTLALGIGASTAVFSVVHAVLLRPLPYPESDRLVELFEENLEVGSQLWRVSALNYLSWGERSKSFEAIAAFGSSGVTATDDRDPELLSASLVTASLFRVLQVAPIVGRPLRPEDEQPGSSPSRGAERIALAQSVRRRPRRRRAFDHTRRRTLSDRRRHAADVPRGRTIAARGDRGRTGFPADGDRSDAGEPREPYAPRRRPVAARRTRSSRPATKCARCPHPWSRSFLHRTRTGACGSRRCPTPCAIHRCIARCSWYSAR